MAAKKIVNEQTTTTREKMFHCKTKISQKRKKKKIHYKTVDTKQFVSFRHVIKIDLHFSYVGEPWVPSEMEC